MVTDTLTEREQRDKRISRIRRAAYIGSTTAVSLLAAIAFVVFEYTGPLAERTSEALLSLVELLAILYLSAGVVDSSNILSNIGRGLNRPPIKPKDDDNR